MASAAAAQIFTPEELKRREGLTFMQRLAEDQAEHQRLLNEKTKGYVARVGYHSAESSKPKEESSGLAKILGRLVMVSAAAAVIYFAAGAYYGFDKINKPVENAYSHVRTFVAHIK